MYDLLTINDFKKKPTAGIKYPVFLFISMMIIGGGVILFGRPYSQLIVSIVGLLATLVITIFAPGLVDWVDKSILFVMISATVIEFYRIGHRYGQEEQ